MFSRSRTASLGALISASSASLCNGKPAEISALADGYSQRRTRAL